MILTVVSLIASISFVSCTSCALYFAFMGDVGISAGFALLSSWWFVIMVLFGLAFMRGRK
jgi:hypothetical protein